MELSQFTDYSLRLLIFVGLKDDELCSVKEIATAYNISQNHLVKVAHNLSKKGYLETFKGKGGGIRLAKPANVINVGEIVRLTESTSLLECFPPRAKQGGCCIAGICKLQGILHQALSKFMQELDAYTLEDLLQNKSAMRSRLKFSK